MKTLKEIAPLHDDLLTLKPEEVGGVILEILNSTSPSESSYLHKGNFINSDFVKVYPQDRRRDIQKVLIEGWHWLEYNGLIAQDPDQGTGWIFITRLGTEIINKDNFKSYLSTGILKKELLHPIIIKNAWSSFARGEYDTAIFIAFKEVEVVTRKFSGQSQETIGVDLMRKVFNVGGVLAQKNLPKGEQESLSHLFAGSIGFFKNPQSHRKVGVAHMIEAARLLVFASHLLSTVEICFFESDAV